MRIRSLLITMLGIAVAAASIYASKEFLAVDPATASVENSTPALVSVVVTGQDIPFGTTIEAHKLTTIQWPAEAVPSGVFTDYSVLIPAAGEEPRRAKRAMVKGELVLPAKLSDFGEKVTIGQTLAPGNRAMAISVNATTSVGGFVTPGDFVDIVLTSRDQRGLRAVTILQNVRIVGVDQKADVLNEQAQVARTVTVEVTPIQGQKLALAQRAGTLSLTLRNIGSQDEVEQDLRSIRLSDIIPNDAPVIQAPAPKPTVKVRRGSAIEEVELEGADEELQGNSR
ncbi:MAG: Flp pilus assembly protein CpaB [Pseudomonadota bacterium]